MKISLTTGNPLSETEEAFLKSMENKLNTALENLEVNLGVFGTHVSYVNVDESGELIIEDRTKETLQQRYDGRMPV